MLLKTILRNTCVALVLLSAQTASAGSLFTQYAPKERNHHTFMSLGYRFSGLTTWHFYETAISLESNNVLAHEMPGLIAEFGTGVELNPSWIYLRFSNSLALVTTPRRGLNSHYQFGTTIAVGMVQGPAKLGVFFKHYSNGSATKLNKGWNFTGVEFSLAF